MSEDAGGEVDRDVTTESYVESLEISRKIKLDRGH